MKRISLNFIYNVLYKIVLIIAPLITTPYLSRKLGVDSIGQYSYIFTLVSMLLLFGGLGTGLYAQRGIAQRRDNLDKKSTFFKEIFLIRLIGISLSLMVFIIISFFQKERIIYLICSIEIIAYIFDISWLYQGDEDFGKIVFRNIILKLATVILIFIFVKSPNDLGKYAFLRAASTLLSNLSIWIFVNQHIMIKTLGKINLKKHIGPIFNLFIPQILIQLYSNCDKLMLKWIRNDNAENGYYDQTYKIIEMCLIFGQALNATLLPRLSYLYTKGKMDEYKELLVKAVRMVMMISFPMFAGIFLISDEFTFYFFGYGFEKVGLLLKLYSPFLLAMFSGLMCQQYLIVTGKEKLYTYMTSFVAIFNIMVNLFLIKIFASIGAVISTLLSEGILMTMILFIVSKDGIITIYDLIYISKPYVFASVSMVFFLIFANYVFPQNLLMLILKIMISIIIYFVLLIIFKDSIIKEVLNKILKD